VESSPETQKAQKKPAGFLMMFDAASFQTSSVPILFFFSVPPDTRRILWNDDRFFGCEYPYGLDSFFIQASERRVPVKSLVAVEFPCAV